MRKLPLAIALFAVLVLAACGGDDSEESAPTTAANAAAATTTPTFTGSGSGEFCQLVNTYRERFTGINQASATPAQLRQLATEAGSAIQQAVAAAPPEIKADVTVVAEAANDYLTKLRQAGYDLRRLGPDAAASLQAPDVAAAVQRFTAYDQSVCRRG